MMKSGCRIIVDSKITPSVIWQLAEMRINVVGEEGIGIEIMSGKEGKYLFERE